MVLSELQTSAPAPARARMHAPLSCCAVAGGGAEKPGVVVVRRMAWLRRTCVVVLAGRTAAAAVAADVAFSITVMITISFTIEAAVALMTSQTFLQNLAGSDLPAAPGFIALVSRIAWSILPSIFVKPGAAPYIPPVIAGMVAACVAVTVVGIACLTRVTAGTRRGRSAVCTRPVGQTWPAATASHQLWSQSVIPLSCRRPTPQLPPLQLPSLVTGASRGI